MEYNYLVYDRDELYCSEDCAAAAGYRLDCLEEFSADEFLRRMAEEWGPNGSPFGYECPVCGEPFHGAEDW